MKISALNSRQKLCRILYVAVSLGIFRPAAFATVSNGNADVVLGQPDFNSSNVNVVEDNRFSSPVGVFNDISVRVWVVDKQNNRVLGLDGFNLGDGPSATSVIGQADFTSGKPNRGGVAGNNTLNQPCGVAETTISGIPYVWVADCGNNRVLRFTSPGNTGATADLVLGQANFTSTMTNRGGSVGLNTLNNPTNLAINEGGSHDLWVSDTGNARVLKFNYTSLATGMPANLVLGKANGADTSGCFPPTVSCLTSPYGISVYGATGDVWVADHGNHRVLKFSAPSSDGAAASIVLGQADFVSGQSNRGGAIAANTLYNPTGVSIARDGSWLAVADQWNNRVLKYVPPFTTGQDAAFVIGQTTFTSASSIGTLDGRFISQPENVIITWANATFPVWVSGYNRVLRFDNPLGNAPSAVRVLGAPDFTHAYNNSIEAKGFDEPRGTVYDPKYGRLFVSDLANRRVLWWNNATSLSTQKPADGVLGQPSLTENTNTVGAAQDRLFGPAGLGVDSSGNLYVADSQSNRVVRFLGASLTTGMNADLVLGQADFNSKQANRGSAAAANTMYQPYSVAIDKYDNVWVSDTLNNRILKFSSATLTNGIDASLVLGQADFTGTSSNRGGSVAGDTLYNPRGIYVDNSDRLWVADNGNSRVIKFDAPLVNGQAANLALGVSSVNVVSAGDGNNANQNSSDYPEAVTEDVLGNVWVADTRNHRITKYSPPFSNGMLAAAVIGQQDFNSGTANRGISVSINTLNWPNALTADNLANIYAVDSQNNRVVLYNSGLSLTDVNPSFVSRSSTSLSASWMAVPGASYVAALFADAAYTTVVAGSSGTQSGNSKTFTGLSTATTYYLEVKLSTETDLAFSQNRISTTTLNLPPTITAIAPSSGTNAGTVDIAALNGTAFQDGAAVRLTRTGQPAINAVSVVWVNSTQLTCSLPLTGAATGTWNIVVTNPDGQSAQKADGFTIKTLPPAPASVTPNTGANNGTVSVTDLAGTEFQPGAVITLEKAGEFSVAAQNVHVQSTLKITCDLPLAGATTGAWNIVVTNPDGQAGTLANGFTITYPAPTVAAITPKAGLYNTTVHITDLGGTGFQSGTTIKLVKSGQADISATNVTVVNPTLLTCDLDLSGAAAGAWDVGVTVPGQAPVVLTGAFSVLAPTTADEPARVYQGIFNPAKGDKSYIATHLSSPGKVTVRVYDSGGRLVRDIFEGDRNSGDFSDAWDGRNNSGSKVASGIYLVRIEGPGIKTTKRVLVVK